MYVHFCQFAAHEHDIHHVENWRRRVDIIEYCVGVVDQSVYEKGKHVEEQEDPATQRRMQAELFAAEVKVSLGFIETRGFMV